MSSISDNLWFEIKHIIPAKKTTVGRPQFCPRRTLNAIFFVLRTGCQWQELPRSMGVASTIHGKFMHWSRIGIFEKILCVSREYYLSNNMDNIWFSIDSTSKKAPFAIFGGKNPTDRSKLGIKQIVIVDKKGAPLKVAVAPANIHDSKLLEKMVVEPAQVLSILTADSAFDCLRLRKHCKKKNVVLLASTNKRRNKNLHQYRPSNRWIVERTIGWFSWYRGLKICWSKTIESHLALLQLAASVQLFRMGGIFV